jgi:predicted phosphodiesterase
MEAKTVTLPIDIDRFTLFFLGDVHEGAANHNETAFKKAVKLIEEKGDAWIGLGDYIDAINHKDPRFNPKEVSERYKIEDLEDLPRLQSDYFMKGVESIKGKCLGLIYGNHEDTYRSHNTFDVVKYMTERMNVANLRHKACISLSFTGAGDSKKSIPIKIWVCHGRGGGGMREGFPINKVFDVFRWVMGDVCVMGHLHQMAHRRAEYARYDYNALRKDPVWFGVNGCFLDKSTEGNDGYFEQSAGMESSIGMLKLTIEPSAMDKRSFKTELSEVYL